MENPEPITRLLDEYMTNCSIEHFPHDILYTIFRLCIAAAPKQKSESSSVILSHVCRRWREYALDTPTMWNSLEFKRMGRYKGWEKQLSYLERSNGALLDINLWSGQCSTDALSASAVSRILQILKPHIHRWRSFKVCIHFKGMRIIGDQLRHASARELEELSLEVWDKNYYSSSRLRFCLFDGDFPKLRTWRNLVELLLRSSKMPPYMANLRVLHLDGGRYYDRRRHHPTMEDVAAMLSRCPKLQQLKLGVSYLGRTEVPGWPPKTRVLLPHLISLTFTETPNDVFEQFCTCIQAPSLRSITSSHIPSTIIPIVAAVNPFPRLQTLTVDFGPHDPAAYEQSVLHNAFSNLSSLTSFTIRSHELPGYFFQTLKTCCPSLVDLEFIRCTFAPLDCVEMARARMESNVMSSLRRLNIHPAATWNLPSQDRLWFLKNIPYFSVKESRVEFVSSATHFSRLDQVLAELAART